MRVAAVEPFQPFVFWDLSAVPDVSSRSFSSDPNSDEIISADTHFTSDDELFVLFNHTDGDGLVVAPTTSKQYCALCLKREATGRKLGLFYVSDRCILIVALPRGDHGVLHLFLYDILIYEMMSMGLIDNWGSISAKTFASASSGAEGDSGGGPTPAPGDGRVWPAVCFEAGVSQSLPSLRTKMRWWFAHSSHHVKIVVLANAFPESVEKRTLLEQWQERCAPAARQGATDTQVSAAARAPTCLQTINVVWAGPLAFNLASRGQKRDRSLDNVVRGPLQLRI